MTWIDSYFDDLRKRLPDESERVFFKNLCFDDGSPLPRNRCHENVDRWVKSNPEHRAVRGWVVSGRCVVDAHSVICDRHGTLWDITFPDAAADGILFLRHRGTGEEFDRARNQQAQHVFL